MERDSERAQAVLEALDGAFPGDGIVIAVAAVGSGSSGPQRNKEFLPCAGWSLTARLDGDGDYVTETKEER